jgi:hypothetical protein
MEKQVSLEKLDKEVCKGDIRARRMINRMRIMTFTHLFSEERNKYFSGYLQDSDISLIEELTEMKVECSTESGEYFYKLG